LSYPTHAKWLGHEVDAEGFTQALGKALGLTAGEPAIAGSVAIHLRLGDYLWPSAAARYGVLKPNYYLKILKKIENFDGITLFTDDMEAARAIHHQLYRKNNSSFASTKNVIEDFKSMAQAEFFIGANSTLSLWISWYRGQIEYPKAKTFVPHSIYRKSSRNKLPGLGTEKPEFMNPYLFTLRHPWVLSRRLRWRGIFWG
jgi:hypothetical protein